MCATLGSQVLPAAERRLRYATLPWRARPEVTVRFWSRFFFFQAAVARNVFISMKVRWKLIFGEVERQQGRMVSGGSFNDELVGLRSFVIFIHSFSVKYI